MSSKKSNGSKKDPSKTPKVWERARREKMKIYFNELQEVLPFYDPSAPMSRFEILQKSKMYIKDLQDQNQDLLNGGFDEVYKVKMTKLKHRVKELIKRVDQLTDLLKTANIMIPPSESYQEGSKNTTFKWMSQHPKKWTEKINVVVPEDKIKNVLTLIKDYKKNSSQIKLKKKQYNRHIEKSEITSEVHVQKTLIKKKKMLKKKCKIINLKLTKAGKSNSYPGSQSPSQFKENQPVDFNLLSNNNASLKSTVLEQNNSTTSETSVNKNPSNQTKKTQISSLSKVTIPQNVILPTVPNVLQPNTLILTNNGSLVHLPIFNSSGAVLNQNSNLLAPAAVLKPNGELISPLVINKPSPVIVLQKPSPSPIFQAAQIINATPQIITSQPGVQILGTTNMYTAASTAVKALPHILSKTPANKKRIARDSTITTYVNKIPIPAPSKQTYVKKSVPVSPKRDVGNAKTKNSVEKNLESLNKKIVENQNERVKAGESIQIQNGNTNLEAVEKEKEKTTEAKPSLESSEKRLLPEDTTKVHKKQKLNEKLLSTAEDNVFKPIENDTAEVFCNLGLPNALNPSLSVSPTAAFLSSFPIVAPTRSEVEDEASEKKSDEGKDPKTNEEQPAAEKNKQNNDNSKEEANVQLSKELTKNSADSAQIEVQIVKDKINVSTSEQAKFFPNNNFTTNSINTNINKNVLVHQQVAQFKSWEQFHQETTETYYMSSETNNHVSSSGVSVGNINPPPLSYSASNENTYKNYLQNTSVKTNVNVQNNIAEQVALESNHFEYLQKESYMGKVATYSNERPLPAKLCTNSMNESYGLAKIQPLNYQTDSGPNYQLIPAKEVSNQRNSRTVNWMTEPDLSNRPPVYGSQSEKMMAAKPPAFTQSDNFYVNNQSTKITNDCTGHFVINDQNKTNYQKSEFYGKDQRCKNVEKRAESKCYNKAPQNSYNIFDYNYSPSCYGDESASKYCQNQYSGKVKKNVTQQKKKSDIHQVNEITSESAKRPPDQSITTIDFNSASNQECFTWVPGKNVEWLPSKSFGLDTNLVVPSTLPTLVGDLALGTSTNDPNQKNISSKSYQSNLKTNMNEVSKDYVDITMGGTSILTKPMEAVDTNKQYFEPFANLSKNIFDVTNTNMNNTQMPKNDYEKINFGNNNNETIVLKNIFELPVSKGSGGDFSRNKQRAINNSQNTFLSVSQLVEPSGFEGNSIKNGNQDPITKVDPYIQNYSSYNNQKSYKNKTRSSHCKFNDRKYNGYKNSGSSSSYTAEALIRSNSNVNYQSNEFSADVGINFFNAKPSQKPEQFSGNNKIDFEINMKSDFSTATGQNIYSDFNFSSPVPNFAIGATVGTDFGNHDSSGNFPAQNNSFFGDFVTPEYSLSDNVSNSLLLPQCSIALQNPFVIDKRNAEKNKTNSKQFTRNRKHYDCTKTTFNEFSIASTSAIFTTSSLACPPIFTTSACQNLLPVPTQSIPISFSSPSFSTSNIPFPPLSSATNSNYHRFPNSSQNPTSGSFLSSNTMFTTCTSKPLSSHNCYSSSPLTSVTNSVISSFPVGNVPLSSSSQSGIPFFSLSNPIIPSSAPTSSSNSLANFNLSTIFPEINQKGNYHYS